MGKKEEGKGKSSIHSYQENSRECEGRGIWLESEKCGRVDAWAKAKKEGKKGKGKTVDRETAAETKAGLACLAVVAKEKNNTTEEEKEGEKPAPTARQERKKEEELIGSAAAVERRKEPRVVHRTRGRENATPLPQA